MFTIQDIFDQTFPYLEGISIDVGTIICAMLLLSFVLIGFDYVKDILGSYFDSMANNRKANAYYQQAEKYRTAMKGFAPDSLYYEEAQLLYRGNLRKSVEHRIAGNSSPDGYGSSSLESGFSIFDDGDDHDQIDNSIKL